MRRNSSVVVAVVFAFAVLMMLEASGLVSPACAAAQATASPTLTTFWGPEEFVRTTAKPLSVTRQIAVTGYEAPFHLHVRNGDANGKNRVSAAAVYINGLPVLQPWDFNQTVGELQREVGLTDPSTLQVFIASTTLQGSRLTVWIEGVPDNIVGPEGRRLEFTNGVILEIPPGAVDQPTEIRTTVVPADIGQGFVANSLLSHDLRYLGGFLGEPDGLQFNVPIEVEFPVERLLPGEIPLQLHIDPELGKAYPTESDLVYDGVAQRVRMKISHFGGPAGTAGRSSTDLNKCWTTECRERREIEALCTDPATNSDPKCEAFDPLQNACCLLYPPPKGPRPPSCSCCREGRIEVRTKAINFDSMTCTIASDTVTVRYPECKCPDLTDMAHCDNGVPVETDTLKGASLGCDELTWSLAVSPNPATVDFCQSITLRSTATGISPKGSRVVIEDAAYWALLRESDNGIVELDPKTGKITGRKPGQAVVRATFSKPGDDLVADVNVNVGPYPEMKVAPNPLEVRVFEQRKLKASVDCLCGVPGYPDCENLSCTGTCSPLRWSLAGDAWAVVDPVSGIVEGKAVGNTTVQAHMVYEGQEFSATVPVKVLPPSVTVKARLGDCDWNADFCYFGSRDGVDLTVQLELNGHPVPKGQDVWVTLAPGLGQTLTPLNPVPGYPDNRQWTNDQGQANWRISEITVDVPIIIAYVTGSAGGVSGSTEARAITDDICDEPLYMSNLSSSYGTSVTQNDSVCNVGYSFSPCLDVGDICINGSISAVDPCDAVPFDHPSRCVLGWFPLWWDTVLVIPRDLKMLLNGVYVDVALTNRASTQAESTNFGWADINVQISYSADSFLEQDPSNYNCGMTRFSYLSEVDNLTTLYSSRCFYSKYRLSRYMFGKPFLLWSSAEASLVVNAVTGAYGGGCSEVATAFVSADISQQSTIQEVLWFDSQGNAHSSDAWVFSCSGKFTTPR